jgi:hypothetical protein
MDTLPIGHSAILALLRLPSLDYIVSGQATFLDVLLGPLIFHVPSVLGLEFIAIPPIFFMAFLFLFAAYPTIYSTDILFKKRGGANVVIEYQYIRKILYVFLIIEIVTITTLYFLTPISNEQQSNLGDQSYTLGSEVGIIVSSREYLETLRSDIISSRPGNLTGLTGLDIGTKISVIDNLRLNVSIQEGEVGSQLGTVVNQLIAASRLVYFLYTMVFVLPVVPISILVKLLLDHARKQFRFYYAMACLRIVSEAKTETDKAEYLNLCLDWYNKFIRRVTDIGIDIETIFLKIVSYSQLDSNVLLDTIVDSFNEGDKLKPMRHMLALLSCWKQDGGILVIGSASHE